MVRAPRWTNDEFELLISSGSASPAALAQRLPARTVGAIEWVRAGVHCFHRGGDVSMLSQMMIDRLNDRSRPVTCPKCGTRI